MGYDFEKVNKDIENENIQLKNIQKNTPLLHHHDTPQPRKEGKLRIPI